MADRALLEALGATRGCVCLVGAGGKKSTMYALAEAHPGRVLLTSTSHMYPYREDIVDLLVTLDAPDSACREIDSGRVVALESATNTTLRVGGVAPARIREIYEQNAFDLCLIKADGARARWIKSPGPDEPLIPEFADTVIYVVSVQACGLKLSAPMVHRPERLGALLGIAGDELISAEHIATLITHPKGALKATREATVIPLINMVDDDNSEALAREIALLALARTKRFSSVVLASMKDQRVVCVVSRD